MSGRFKAIPFTGLLMILLFSGCEPERVVISSGSEGFEGYHVGYSWSGEARGTSLEDAGAFIETILRLDEDGVIQHASMRYWQQADGFWTTRQSGNALVSVDFSVDPGSAGLGSEYSAADSMFSISAVNMMSLYSSAVAGDETVAVTIVEPLTRYRFEVKLPPGFDYTRPFSDLSIGSDYLKPVVRTAGGAFLAPAQWSELEGAHLFDFHDYSHVLTDRGPFAGMNGDTSIEAFLAATGIEFSNGRPVQKTAGYGYFGLGGWRGNYDAIASDLIGRNARDLRSLVNWDIELYRNGINEQNQFGVDVVSGATRTVQNSVDGISGATVRMSRESTSYQRALVDAGILSEDEVIIGRF
ncbi:hypothetical protein [Spirochaeta dissipatitropha]